jgi:hypothetical protein
VLYSFYLKKFFYFYMGEAPMRKVESVPPPVPVRAKRRVHDTGEFPVYKESKSKPKPGTPEYQAIYDAEEAAAEAAHARRGGIKEELEIQRDTQDLSLADEDKYRGELAEASRVAARSRRDFERFGFDRTVALRSDLAKLYHLKEKVGPPALSAEIVKVLELRKQELAGLTEEARATYMKELIDVAGTGDRNRSRARKIEARETFENEEDSISLDTIRRDLRAGEGTARELEKEAQFVRASKAIELDREHRTRQREEDEKMLARELRVSEKRPSSKKKEKPAPSSAWGWFKSKVEKYIG